MAGKTLLRFDYGQATAFKDKLAREIDQIDSALSEIKTQVASCQTWWISPAADAFVTNFEKTKQEIHTDLVQVLDMYQKRIQAVADFKEANERKHAARYA